MMIAIPRYVCLLHFTSCARSLIAAQARSYYTVQCLQVFKSFNRRHWNIFLQASNKHMQSLLSSLSKWTQDIVASIVVQDERVWIELNSNRAASAFGETVTEFTVALLADGLDDCAFMHLVEHASCTAQFFLSICKAFCRC